MALPKPKRPHREGPETAEVALSEVQRAGGMRGRMILQSSLGGKKARGLNIEDEDTDDERDDGLIIVKSFSGDTPPLGDAAKENRKKFGFPSSKKGVVVHPSKKEAVESLSKTDVSSKQTPVLGTKGKSTESAVVTTNNDNVLSDILCELAPKNAQTGPPIQSNIHKRSLDPTKSLKTDLKSKLNKTKTSSNNNQSDSPLQPSFAAMATDENEADDALLDIMAELKETLTEQNELSAKKSSGKKPLNRSFTSHDSKLDTSISRQLDFDFTGNVSNKEKVQHKGKILSLNRI